MRDRLVDYLPRYSPYAAMLPGLLNLRDRLPGLAWASERALGFSARRALPRWRRDGFRGRASQGGAAGEVVLFVDTFNRWFEPENASAALAVLQAAGYRVQPLDTALDWSEWQGFGGAVEMCNNNGACRKSDAAVMCPSYRVTRDEQHVTRGRANSLRLAITGQLGAYALVSDAMRETMDL